MHVVLGGVRDVEIHDVSEVGNVDATRRDVGGDEHAVLTALEVLERARALRLRTIAVDQV